MKRLFVLTTIIAASLITTTGYSQVYVNAHVGIGLPRIHGVPIPIPVPVIRTSVPVCQEAAPAPVAYDYNAYPDAAYYTYPAWNGHYRDRVYYEHYRPVVERNRRVVAYDHRGYDRRDDHHRRY